MIKTLSLRIQLIAMALLAVLVALASAGAVLLVLERGSARDQLTQEMTSTALLLGSRVSTALVFVDEDTAQENMQALRGMAQVDMACLFNSGQQLFAAYASQGDASARCTNLLSHSVGDARIVRVSIPVIAKDTQVGRLEMWSTNKPLADRLWGQLVSLAVALGVAFVIAGVMALGLQRAIVNPITRIRDVANRVMDTKDFSLRAPDLGRHETGRLAMAFNNMLDTIERQNSDLAQMNQELESRVQRRTAELAESNASLTQAIDTLQHAQSELVQKDKLASLGALVAGVAHELNTPLGNSILVASSMELAAQNLGHGMQTGQLTKSGAVAMIEQIKDGTALLTRNLERASALIVNFKQVAVDQTSEQRRSFDLQRVIQEVVETLQPQFKHTPHTVVVQVPDGLAMDSYPGPLGQVITNLVMNGLIHAFDGQPAGVVDIRAEMTGPGKVKLRVHDNGIGIHKEHLAKVFDPFFTTKLGQGGSGLGLNIVYNIVVSTLGGDIRVGSEPGEGTTFTIDIPLQAPLRV